MARLEPIHQWVAGIEIRPNIFNEIGDVLPCHVHDHPHLTLVSRGSFRMWRALTESGLSNAEPEIIGSAAMTGAALPSWIEIPASMYHSFEVVKLENGCAAMLCLWAGGVK